MDVSSIAGSAGVSQAQSVWQSRRQQFEQNFEALGAALQSGNLTDAQQSFQALLQGLSAPTTSASSMSSNGTPASAVAQDLAALSTALDAGKLTDAQQAYQALITDLQKLQQAQGPHHRHHHHHRTDAATNSDSTATAASIVADNTGATGSTIETSA